MITKLRYTGTKEGGALTQGNLYTVLAFTAQYNTAKAIVIDDTGLPYVTQTAIDDPDNWVIDSVTECGNTVYPPV